MVSEEEDDRAILARADDRLAAQIGVEVSAELDDRRPVHLEPEQRRRVPLILWMFWVGLGLWYLLD